MREHVELRSFFFDWARVVDSTKKSCDRRLFTSCFFSFYLLSKGEVVGLARRPPRLTSRISNHHERRSRILLVQQDAVLPAKGCCDDDDGEGIVVFVAGPCHPPPSFFLFLLRAPPVLQEIPLVFLPPRHHRRDFQSRCESSRI